MARETWLERNFTLVVISVVLKAHGNGDIDEEAFFETVRWDGVES